jgi:hypothetical protein
LSILIADDKRFFVTISEAEIEANYFFDDSVNDSRCVVFHILKSNRMSICSTRFCFLVNFDLYPRLFLFSLTKCLLDY